jgi:hypothetical protein
MVRHSSIPLPETTAKSLWKAVPFAFTINDFATLIFLRFAVSLRPKWRLHDAPY